MKSSIVIITFFLLGVAAGLFIPELYTVADGWDMYVLMVLMFLVGVSIGSDKNLSSAIKVMDKRLLLLPFCTIIGTLITAYLVSFCLPWNKSEVLAVGSGFAYYSLSSVFITQFKGAELGTVALLANISREILTLLLAPLLVLWFGKLAPISAGGATTMDTTLPIITQTSGKEYVILAIYHGFIVDLSVPFLVSLFCLI